MLQTTSYSREFRMQIVRRILNGEKVPALARELGIHPKLLYDWTRRVKEGGEENLRGRGRPRKSEETRGADRTSRRIPELERTVAYQRLAIEFLQACLASVADQAMESHLSIGRDIVFEAMETMLRGRRGLTIKAMCELARVGRTGYYRYMRNRAEGAGLGA